MRDWYLIVFYSLMRNKLKTQSSVASGNLSCMVAVGLFSFGFPAANSLLETWGVFSLITLRNLLGLLFLVGLMAFKLGVRVTASTALDKGVLDWFFWLWHWFNAPAACTINDKCSDRRSGCCHHANMCSCARSGL